MVRGVVGTGVKNKCLKLHIGFENPRYFQDRETGDGVGHGRAVEEFRAQTMQKSHGETGHSEFLAGTVVVQVRRQGDRLRGRHAYRTVGARVPAGAAEANGRTQVFGAARHVLARPSVGQRVHRAGQNVRRPGVHANGERGRRI